MTREAQRLPDYLEHILEAIARIQRYTAGMSQPEFVDDELVQDGVIRNLEVVGEASRNIERGYPDFAAAHPELPLAIATTCATPCHTAISWWTCKSCGGRSTATCRSCRDW